MPFTFSHPALALPFTLLPKRWVSVTGLIVGSITPDFEYFIRMRIYSVYSHEWWAILWFGVPVGLLLCFAFHQIIRDPLFANLPSVLQKRLSRFYGFHWRKHFTHHWPVVCFSIIVGAATHVIWDAFTHTHGHFVEATPFLQKDVELLGSTYPMYKWFQHTSTVAGFCVVAIVFWNLSMGAQIAKPSKNFWISVFLISFLIYGAHFLWGTPLNYQIGNEIVALMSSGMLGLFIASILQKLGRIR